MVRGFLVVVCVAGTLASGAVAKAETATFNFAPVGSSYLAALLADDPLVGKEIVTARIYLDVESFPARTPRISTPTSHFRSSLSRGM